MVDNDFAQSQFGAEHTSQEFLEVTSAHEFHHASQFAYDWGEDAWLMEGTAANIEETVYPAINDNVFFLHLWSPLTRPSSPLDRGGFGDSEYGSWIFWRYLQEKIGGDPSIVREIWERADAFDPSPAPGDDPPDDYSLEAVRHELAERDLAFADVFAGFATTNRLLDYADAADADYPSPALTKTVWIGRKKPLTSWQSWRINHLAARYFSFRPETGRAGRLEASRHDPTAEVRSRRHPDHRRCRRLDHARAASCGSPTAMPAALRASARNEIKRIEVVLSNGSTRTTSCWTSPGPPAYSCAGRPLDDGRVFQLRGRIYR